MKPQRFNTRAEALAFVSDAVKSGLRTLLIDVGGEYLVQVWSREGEYA